MQPSRSITHHTGNSFCLGKWSGSLVERLRSPRQKLGVLLHCTSRFDWHAWGPCHLSLSISIMRFNTTWKYVQRSRKIKTSSLWHCGKLLFWFSISLNWYFLEICWKICIFSIIFYVWCSKFQSADDNFKDIECNCILLRNSSLDGRCHHSHRHVFLLLFSGVCCILYDNRSAFLRNQPVLFWIELLLIKTLVMDSI